MEMNSNRHFSHPGPFTVHAPQPVDCPLGQIVYAGTKWNSRATYAHAPPPDFMRPTPHYLLVYTLEGEADYVDDTGVRTVLRKGILMWTRPGVNQSYGPRPGSRWSEFFVWFAGPLFDTWQDQGLPGERSRQLQLEPLDYWLEQFRTVVQPPPAAPAETPLVRLCRFQRILAEALQAHDANRATAEITTWRAIVCHKLEAGSPTSPSLGSIAASMNMSYSLFRRRFLEVTGTSPGRYRTVALVRRACRRLLEGNASLAEIANELGFHDPFHFSRRFKQVVGMSPSSFRRQTTTGKLPAAAQ